jgi:predicted esterase
MLPAKKSKKGETYPEPLVIAPTGPHTHTIILLHGRGSNAERFGLEFLKSRTSEGQTLQELFPGLKFVFPTAKKRRSTVLKRIPINQWFDYYSLSNPNERQELQYEGLHETSVFLHRIIAAEAEKVALGRVALGGLSQGCAAGLQVLMNFYHQRVLLEISEDDDADAASKSPPRLAGFVGMSGWLPFACAIAEIGSVNDHEDDIFEHGEEHEDGAEAALASSLAFNLARDIASLEPISFPADTSPPFVNTPIFLGHGAVDEKVSVRLGEEARDTLEGLGCDVQWKAYEELGHWYKVPDEMDDVVEFLERIGFGVARVSVGDLVRKNESTGTEVVVGDAHLKSAR